MSKSYGVAVLCRRGIMLCNSGSVRELIRETYGEAYIKLGERNEYESQRERIGNSEMSRQEINGKREIQIINAPCV